MKIRIFDICRNGTHALGPGLRYAIWVQGCPRACRGCITPESRPAYGGVEMDTADIAADIILAENIDGITVSGGEPFMQAEAVADILAKVSAYRPELTSIVYTGYTHDRLAAMPEAQSLLGLTDILIDGPYVEELNDNRGIRGSANQRVIPLTPRLAAHVAEMEGARRMVERIAEPDGTVSAIGVPHT